MKKAFPFIGISLFSCFLFVNATAQTCVAPQVDTATGKIIVAGNPPRDSITISWLHPVSGTERLLVVQVGGNRYSDSVTFRGKKLTLLDSASHNVYFAEMWYQVNPDTGSGMVQVYYPTGSGSFNPQKSAASISFINVDQNTPFGTTAGDTNNVCPASLLVRSDTNELVLDMIVKDDFYPPIEDPSQTKLYGVKYGFNNAVAGSVKPGADSVVMSWTWSFCNALDWVMLAVPIKPSCVTGVVEHGKDGITGIYPNPVSEFLHYIVKGAIPFDCHITISDVTGKTVRAEQVKPNQPVDVSGLPDGIYFLRIQSESKIFPAVKFVKAG